MSSTILISSRITFFSFSRSSGANAGCRTRSERRSTATGEVLVEHLDVIARELLGGERV